MVVTDRFHCITSYRVTRPKPGVTEICARGVFFLSLLQSNMKSCAIFEIHRWSILLQYDCTVAYIHALHTPMGSRCIPRTAPSVNEIYLPKHSWSFYRWKFSLTGVKCGDSRAFIRTFVFHSHRWTIIVTHCILAHFGTVQISLNAFI